MWAYLWATSFQQLGVPSLGYFGHSLINKQTA